MGVQAYLEGDKLNHQRCNWWPLLKMKWWDQKLDTSDYYRAIIIYSQEWRSLV